MTLGKRGREPAETLDYTIKHHRVQKKAQTPDPVPQLNARNSNEEESGRPGSASNRAAQAESIHSLHIQLPPEQPDQGGRPRLRLKVNPPRPQSQPDPSQAGPNDPGSSHSETSTCYSQDVTNYDVEPGLEAVGTPQAQDIEYWGSNTGAAEFIRSQSGLETDWVGIRPLGKGGFGIAGLWEIRGDDGQTMKVRIHTRQSVGKILTTGKANGN